jgi:hypothetical protein
MPTPNERDWEVVHGMVRKVRLHFGDLDILADAIAAYREKIIASEREAAADRAKVLREALGMAIHVAVNFGRDHPARDDMLAGPTKIYHDSAAILDGQSAKLHSNIIPFIEAMHCAEGRPIIAERFADNGEHSHWIMIDPKTGDVLAAETGEEPATPLQEARDRGNYPNGFSDKQKELWDLFDELGDDALAMKIVDMFYLRKYGKTFDEYRAALAAKGKE